MDTLRQDLRFAFRLLWKDRAFALTTLLTLALCIGANTAIFTVVRSVLLRPLPYPEAGRLVSMYDSFPGAGVERAGTSVPNYFDRLPLTSLLESQALYQFGGFRVGEGASAEGVASMEVTPSFFRVLRTNAVRGRLFTEDEGQLGRHRVAVLSYTFAQRQPGGLDGIVGRDLRLNDELYTVVGVLPQDFTFFNPDLRVWVPLAFTDKQRSEEARHSQNHEEIGRLAPGATLTQAQARIDALNAVIVERAGPLKQALINAGYHTKLVPLEADVVRKVRASLQLLWGGVLFVLLIAAVNITNLSLVRASGRLKELATRHALGADRARVDASARHRDDAADDHRRKPRSRAGVLEPRHAVVAGPGRHAARPRDPDGRHGRGVHGSVWRWRSELVVGAVPAMQLSGPEPEHRPA